MADWKAVDDRALLTAARRDAEAFGAFYARHEQRLLVYLVRRTASGEVAADLCAEVFAVALEACRNGFASPETPVAWLFGIANHKLADAVRRKYVDDRARRRLQMRTIELSRGQLSDIELLAHADEAALLLSELSPEQREAVLARVVDDQGYGQIARDLRCSESVVRKRVSRGLAALRVQLEEDR